ncbi:MAG: hypothetical protein JSV24_07090 [Bacteroidales bacterium]|nr:MAG: hypothetical protein JSV24_07090 [Bacteroidales bacterium]
MPPRKGKVVIEARFVFESDNDLQQLKNALRSTAGHEHNRRSFNQLFTNFFGQFNPTGEDGDPLYHVVEDPDD